MKEMEIESHAKVNLTLDVLEKRPDGYHNLETIMQEIGMKDIIKIEEQGEGIEIIGPNDTKEYLYKITFRIHNPEFIEKKGEVEPGKSWKFNYNVWLKRNGRKMVSVFVYDQEITPGMTIENIEGVPFVRYSTKYYDQVCLEFDTAVITATGEEEDKICNPISFTQGSATLYPREVVAGEEAAEEEALLNDI